jgi:mRNA interferase MazF
MGKPLAGDVVILPFPQADLSAGKRRPALVVATLPGNDLILCQITSHQHFDSFSVELRAGDFETGGLSMTSYIRPNRLFTVEHTVIHYVAGHTTTAKLAEVKKRLRDLFL